MEKKERERLDEERRQILLKVRKFLMGKDGDSATPKKIAYDLKIPLEEIEIAVSKLREIAILEGGGPKTIKLTKNRQREDEYYF